MINQAPIGKSSRSNPVTYVKAYDDIREIFSKQQLSKIRGYKPGIFSFNTEGGRCETCKGDGDIVVEMQFLADVHLECDECHGKRFKTETLDVTYKGKNIYERYANKNCRATFISNDKIDDIKLKTKADFLLFAKDIVTEK